MTSERRRYFFGSLPRQHPGLTHCNVFGTWCARQRGETLPAAIAWHLGHETVGDQALVVGGYTQVRTDVVHVSKIGDGSFCDIDGLGQRCIDSGLARGNTWWTKGRVDRIGNG